MGRGAEEDEEHDRIETQIKIGEFGETTVVQLSPCMVAPIPDGLFSQTISASWDMVIILGWFCVVKR